MQFYHTAQCHRCRMFWGGACNWHADCRNVHQSWIECSFLYHKPSPKAFQRIWQYIQPASQPQTTCNHTSPGTFSSSIFTSKIVWDQPPGQLLQQSVCITKEFLHKLRNRLREAHLHARHPHRGLDLTAVRHRNRIEWANAHIRWRLALWRGVSSQMNPGFHCTGQMADSVYGVVVGERFAEVNVVAHGGGGVMVWAGVCYGQRTQVHFIDGIWMHRDTVTRSWGPLLCHSSMTITSCCSMIMHGPMLQGSVHNSWKLKTSQFLHGQHTHRTCHPLSMFGMLWIGVYDSVFQFLPISSNFAQPLKRSGPTFHRHNQQPDQLYEKEMCCTAWGKW